MVRLRSGVGVTARWMIDMELSVWGPFFSINTQLSMLSVGVGYSL